MMALFGSLAFRNESSSAARSLCSIVITISGTGMLIVRHIGLMEYITV